MTNELPDDVIAFIRDQVGQVYHHGVDPAQVLLGKYAPKPRWSTGDVVASNVCTALRRDDGSWACSLSSQVSHTDKWADEVRARLLIRNGNPVSS